MKQYYKEINGEQIFYKDPLLLDGMQIFNPSEEIILMAGWMEYIEPEPPEPEPPAA